MSGAEDLLLQVGFVALAADVEPWREVLGAGVCMMKQLMMMDSRHGSPAAGVRVAEWEHCPQTDHLVDHCYSFEVLRLACNLQMSKVADVKEWTEVVPSMYSQGECIPEVVQLNQI